MGWGLWGSMDSFFYNYIPGFSAATFDLMAQQFADNTFLTIFTAGFTPIPFKIFTIAAGAAAVPLTSEAHQCTQVASLPRSPPPSYAFAATTPPVDRPAVGSNQRSCAKFVSRRKRRAMQTCAAERLHGRREERTCKQVAPSQQHSPGRQHPYARPRVGETRCAQHCCHRAPGWPIASCLSRCAHMVSTRCSTIRNPCF